MQRLHTTIWSQFPIELQPEIDVILPLVRVGSYHPQPLTPHPNLKPELQRQLQSALAVGRADARMSWAADYDHRSRAIRFDPSAMSFGETDLSRIGAHEAGHDIAGKEQLLQYATLSAADKENIEILLREGFDPDKRPSSVYVLKQGFRKMLMADNFFISDIVPAESKALDEVFSLAYEMITGQLLIRGGNMAAFERDIVEARVWPLKGEENPQFFNLFFQLLYSRDINWRQFLMAFKTGELDDLTEGLLPYFKHRTQSIIGEIILTIQAAEDRMQAFNSGAQS